MEKGALNLCAVYRDIELGIFETADIDLLGNADSAPDRNRGCAAEKIAQIVRLCDLDIVAIDRGIGQLSDNDYRFCLRFVLVVGVRFDRRPGLCQRNGRPAKRGCGEKARPSISHVFSLSSLGLPTARGGYRAPHHQILTLGPLMRVLCSCNTAAAIFLNAD